MRQEDTWPHANRRLQSSYTKSLVRICAMVGTVVALAGPSYPSEPSGLESTVIANGKLSTSIPLLLKPEHRTSKVEQEISTITVVKFTVAPGGSFGWHRHGGPVWAVVISGTLSLYDGSRDSCRTEIVRAGEALLDPGDRVHTARNATNQPVEIYATFMLPEGGEMRIDAAPPSNCPRH